jgi:hypothetical protein
VEYLFQCGTTFMSNDEFKFCHPLCFLVLDMYNCTNYCSMKASSFFWQFVPISCT